MTLLAVVASILFVRVGDPFGWYGYGNACVGDGAYVGLSWIVKKMRCAGG